MRLITHDGTFHYDELLATAILLKIYPDSVVIRTRNEDLISSGDIVYDVGRVFDVSKNRFDHHQISFKETYSPNYTVRMSSAGLVYKYFCSKLFETRNFFKDSPIYEDIKEKIYKEFILSADAIDNGVEIFSEVIPRTIQAVVANFNIYYKDDEKTTETQRFEAALEFVTQDLDRYLNFIFKDFAVSYLNLLEELKNCKGKVFVTDNQYSSDLIFLVDKKIQKDLQYCIVKRKDECRILTILQEIGKFGIRYPLHKEWRGLSGEEISNISGIPGCIFVHATGFTGANKTLEGALEMCKVSWEYLQNE